MFLYNVLDKLIYSNLSVSKNALFYRYTSSKIQFLV